MRGIQYILKSLKSEEIAIDTYYDNNIFRKIVFDKISQMVCCGKTEISLRIKMDK